MQILGNRLNSLNNFTIDNGMRYNSEQHMKTITQLCKIDIIFIDLKGNRIRANRTIVKDF